MLTGFMPFGGEDMKELFKSIINTELDLEQFNKISSEAKDFLQRLLTKDPKKRITVTEALRHLWIQQHTS